MFNLYPTSDVHRAIEILDRLGIADQAPKRAEALSGGQQQRVAIARALMQDPKIILADEPIATIRPQESPHFNRTWPAGHFHRVVRNKTARTIIQEQSHFTRLINRRCDVINTVGIKVARNHFDW